MIKFILYSKKFGKNSYIVIANPMGIIGELVMDEGQYVDLILWALDFDQLE